MREVVPFKMVIIRVSLTTTAQPLGKLVKAAMAAKTLDLPNNNVQKVVLYPSDGNVRVQDAYTTDYVALAATTRAEFASADVFDRLNLVASTGTPTVDVEAYFGQ